MFKVSPPPSLKKGNGSGLAESDFEKAGEFNGQFTDVFAKSEQSQVHLLNRKAPFMEDIVVSKEDVTKLLKGLNPSKSLGPDELHPRVLKELASELGLPFADDCVCYREIKNVEDTEKLQKDIDRIGSWARKWGVRFQPVKCNMMQLTNKSTSKTQASYKHELLCWKNVESIKYLGATITKDLKWNTHISNMCTKANRTPFFTKSVFLPLDVREASYKGLVRPILEYGNSVWDIHYEGLIDDLEKVQKRAHRFVTRNYTYEKGMTDILKNKIGIPAEKKEG